MMMREISPSLSLFSALARSRILSLFVISLAEIRRKKKRKRKGNLYGL